MWSKASERAEEGALNWLEYRRREPFPQGEFTNRHSFLNQLLFSERAFLRTGFFFAAPGFFFGTFLSGVFLASFLVLPDPQQMSYDSRNHFSQIAFGIGSSAVNRAVTHPVDPTS